jgi:hypothetical protein
MADQAEIDAAHQLLDQGDRGAAMGDFDHLVGAATRGPQMRLRQHDPRRGRWPPVELVLEAVDTWPGRIHRVVGHPGAGALSDATEVDLYVEGRDARGRVVTRDAGPLAPRTLEVTAPDRPRGGEGGGDLASEPWLWILVGVAVVGASVGIGVGVALSDPGIPTGTLNPGIVRLP